MNSEKEFPRMHFFRVEGKEAEQGLVLGQPDSIHDQVRPRGINDPRLGLLCSASSR